MQKTILISQFSLPYNKTGSWTTMYHNYLRADHQIDYIICNEPEVVFENVKYSFVKETALQKIRKRVAKNPYVAYIEALDKIVNTGEKYVIQLVDNFGIVPFLIQYLNRKKIRNHCYIQFFYHGHSPFYGNFESRFFYENIDEMVLLTQLSYQEHKNGYTVLPCRFSILHNGIDTTQFKVIATESKLKLKQEKGLEDKTVFIWCSKDLPKKGLDFILGVWKKIVAKEKNIVLLVIGATREQQVEGVHFLGEIPNNELSKYYQLSDCYLFPTLCQEGFGLCLIEALHCGCYAMASALGGISEVLEKGKYGKLIQNPHFENEWLDAIENYLKEPNHKVQLPTELYSHTIWSQEMNVLIRDAKSRLVT